MNMKEWINDLKQAKGKKPLPILSFPSISLLGVSVGEIISDSELQARGMAEIAKRTCAAAAVSFMDLSVEAECFGAEILVSDDEVPTVKKRIIEEPDDAFKLNTPHVGSGRTSIYIDAIRRAKTLITDRPVIAGMIGPYSLAARLFDVSEIMINCYDEPEAVHSALEKATNFLTEYAMAYKAIGADGIMIAEPVAGLLSASLEEEFSSPYVKRIVDAVQDDTFAVIYHNCGDNVSCMLTSILGTGCAAYHFGNAVDMENDIITKLPSDVLVMGNIDPAGVLRMGTPESVREQTLKLMQRCSKYDNFLLSSGCDIPPMTPWENIDAFFAAAREFYGN